MPFYDAMGRATSAWAQLEDALRDLFTHLIIFSVSGTPAFPHHNMGIWVLGDVFYSSTNFRARLSLLERIVHTVLFEEELISEWNAIQNRSLEKYKRRNLLAHGLVYGNGDEKGFIRFSILDSSNRRVMNYKQTCAASQSFRRLAGRISLFRLRIMQTVAARTATRVLAPAPRSSQSAGWGTPLPPTPE
jgi:hypothetical protein